MLAMMLQPYRQLQETAMKISSTGMAKTLAGEKVAPTDMNYWKPGFPRGLIIKSEGEERAMRVITDFNAFRRKPEDMPKPQRIPMIWNYMVT